MSESHRERDKSSNTTSSQNNRNSKDQLDRYNRKRPHLELENVDAKVFVRNLPTKKVTDEELLDFFKQFGKVSDIRVFKDHTVVQYNRSDDAKKLFKDGHNSLIFKGNKLDVLSARDVRSTSAKSSSSTDRSSIRTHERISLGQSGNYEPTRKKFPTHERSNFILQSEQVGLELDEPTFNSIARSNSRRSSSESISINQSIPYAILTGPKNSNEIVDCQIIIVNIRQRNYAEEIESRLCCHGLVTSIILLREDYTLTEAIDNAARLQCLYGVIAMPMHEERRTASFHILHGQTEEHRNLTLEDGIHIIITNYISYKERFHNGEINSYHPNNGSTIYSSPSPLYEYPRQLNNSSQEETTPPVLNLGDKLPLSMLLCLLADGRQLTLEEIDRVLVYLLEKKAKMLTLPAGTLPPLPAQYATITTTNNQTGSGIVSNTRSTSGSDSSSGKSSTPSTEISTSIAEQIRQILSTNIIKPNASNQETISPPVISKNLLDKLPDIVKVENTILSQAKNHVKEASNEYVQQHNNQSSFSYSKTESIPAIPSSFNYTSSSSVSTTNSSVPLFAAPNLSSYSSVTPSLGFNSTVKPASSVPVSSFVSQPPQYFYQIPSQTVYQSPLNSTAANTAAAFFQAYSQFNVQSTTTPSMVPQQISAQQQQIRK